MKEVKNIADKWGNISGMYACVDVLILNTTNWKLLPLQLEESKKEMKLIKPWIVRKSCTKTKMQKKLGEHFYVWLLWSCHLKEVSRSLSLSHQLFVFFSNSGSELWFFVLLSSLSSVTMRNSVCSRDGGGADIKNDTGKEGKSSQLLSIREKKNESDWVQRENR